MAAQHNQGRVLDYVMQLPEGTPLELARTLAMAELPGDAVVVFYLVKDACAILEAKSATLVPIFSEPNLGGDGTVDFVLTSTDAQGNTSYNTKDINTMTVSLGFGLASAQSTFC